MLSLGLGLKPLTRVEPATVHALEDAHVTTLDERREVLVQRERLTGERHGAP